MKNEMVKLLNEKKVFQKLLFIRGYLLTTKKFDVSKHPFYNNWNCLKVDNYYLYINNNLGYYIKNDKQNTIILIGHAYNPINKEIDENKIISTLLSKYNNKTSFYNYFNKLSGVFVIFIFGKNEKICLQDCCGIMPVVYGNIDGNYYFSSHSNLIGDLLNLSMDPYIRKYINSWMYKIGIRQLCGLDTAFKELKILSPNNILNIFTLKTTRFYPLRKLGTKTNIKMIEKILVNSIDCLTKKYNCSVSLTGGIDSKMTLSATKNYKNKLKYFSFISSEAEEKDAIAAHSICNNLKIKHEIFNIKEKEYLKDYELLTKIIDYNTSNILKLSGHDFRKIIHLYLINSIELEIKSHISEIGRAFFYKKIGKKRFNQRLTPREMSNLAKRNMFNRILLHKMDNSFKQFIKLSNFGNFPYGYDETDMFYWENRMCAWGAFVKQSFDISHDTTMIYNNRFLMDLFLKFSLEDRINDVPQKQITNDLYPDINKMNIHNENKMESKKRILLEKIFFNINTKLPF